MTTLSNGQDNALDNSSTTSDPWTAMDPTTYDTTAAGDLAYDITWADGQIDINDDGAAVDIADGKTFTWDTGIAFEDIEAIVISIEGLTRTAQAPAPGVAFTISETDADHTDQKGAALRYTSATATTVDVQEVTDTETLNTGWASRTNSNGKFLFVFTFANRTADTIMSDRACRVHTNSGNPPGIIVDTPNWSVANSATAHINMTVFQTTTGSGNGQLTYTAGTLKYQVITFN